MRSARGCRGSRAVASRACSRGRHALALFISDVPGDDPDVIGSGLLGRDAGRADGIERHVVANVETPCARPSAAAHAHGLELDACAPRVEGDAADGRRRLLETRCAPADADGIVWGGESTVTLPAAPRPRRAQHASGACLRAATARRRAAGCCSPRAPMARMARPATRARSSMRARSSARRSAAVTSSARGVEFDSGTALEAAGDLVHTGPTGTNVGDILIAHQTIRDARCVANPGHACSNPAHDDALDVDR